MAWGARRRASRGGGRWGRPRRGRAGPAAAAAAAHAGAAAAARAPVGVEEESLALLRVARDVRAPLLGGGGPRLRPAARRAAQGRRGGRGPAGRAARARAASPGGSAMAAGSGVPPRLWR